MLTYIIEDSPLKAGLLKQFFAERFARFHVEIRGSYQSGLKLIQSDVPELIILDMTLPTFDRVPNAREGRLRPLGGYDLMRKIRLRNIKTKIIVVTQLESFGEGDSEMGFDEMALLCAREFPTTFCGSVYFDQREAAWQDSLQALIEKLIPDDKNSSC